MKHPSDWTYHIATKCLSKMKDVHKIQFANMDWKGDKVIERLAGEMKVRQQQENWNRKSRISLGRLSS